LEEDGFGLCGDEDEVVSGKLRIVLGGDALGAKRFRGVVRVSEKCEHPAKWLKVLDGNINYDEVSEKVEFVVHCECEKCGDDVWIKGVH